MAKKGDSGLYWDTLDKNPQISCFNTMYFVLVCLEIIVSWLKGRVLLKIYEPLVLLLPTSLFPCISFHEKRSHMSMNLVVSQIELPWTWKPESLRPGVKDRARWGCRFIHILYLVAQIPPFCFTELVRISSSGSVEIAMVDILFLFLKEMHLDIPPIRIKFAEDHWYILLIKVFSVTFYFLCVHWIDLVVFLL